jgi:hypothetical protein
MSATTWVVQHGRAVVDGPVPFRYATPLYDVLSVGPHHADARIEKLLRQAAGMPSDLDLLDEHQPLLDDDDVVLLTERELGSVLAALWWLDALTTRGADVSGVRLAIAPRWADAPAVVRMVDDAAPIGDDLAPLLALRRAIAADDDTLSVPLDGLSEPRRAWASVTARIRDLLPDARGLDLFDARLLDHTGGEWSRAVEVVSRVLGVRDDAHRVGDITLWNRIRVLAAELSMDLGPDDDETDTALLEVEVQGPIEMRFARVRRTRFGDEVRAGRDALQARAFDRWVGGRFLTRERILHAGLRRV